MNSSCEVVFVPGPGIGHLVSTLGFAKRLMDRTHGLSATVLCLSFPFSDDAATAFTKSVAAGIKLIHIPPADSGAADPRKSMEHGIYTAVERAIPHVREALKETLGSSTTRVVGLVLDFFCLPLLDLASELGLDSYMFMTSNVAFVSLMMHLRDHPANLDAISLPGFKNPVPAGALPVSVFNKEGGHAAYVNLARRFRDVKGIVVNSFSELEGKAAQSLGPAPAMYLVGPVVELAGPGRKQDGVTEWLDRQPEGSVVFVCFGSRGRFGAEQTREIARGLEASGSRFVWCARTEEGNLPEDFPGERGLVLEGWWAPQAEVLGHAAVGGFVSHCGWNSLLESLWHGVPAVAWPLYAEQRLNVLLMARELGLAVEIEGGPEFTAEHICKAVRRVMDRRSTVRERVSEMSSVARKAVAEGGSSFAALDRLVGDLLRR